MNSNITLFNEELPDVEEKILMEADLEVSKKVTQPFGLMYVEFIPRPNTSKAEYTLTLFDKGGVKVDLPTEKEQFSTLDVDAIIHHYTHALTVLGQYGIVKFSH